jgi:hypothetical protein
MQTLSAHTNHAENYPPNLLVLGKTLDKKIGSKVEWNVGIDITTELVNNPVRASISTNNKYIVSIYLFTLPYTSVTTFKINDNLTQTCGSCNFINTNVNTSTHVALITMFNTDGELMLAQKIYGLQIDSIVNVCIDLDSNIVVSITSSNCLIRQSDEECESDLISPIYLYNSNTTGCYCYDNQSVSHIFTICKNNGKIIHSKVLSASSEFITTSMLIINNTIYISGYYSGNYLRISNTCEQQNIFKTDYSNGLFIFRFDAQINYIGFLIIVDNNFVNYKVGSKMAVSDNNIFIFGKFYSDKISIYDGKANLISIVDNIFSNSHYILKMDNDMTKLLDLVKISGISKKYDIISLDTKSIVISFDWKNIFPIFYSLDNTIINNSVQPNSNNANEINCDALVLIAITTDFKFEWICYCRGASAYTETESNIISKNMSNEIFLNACFRTDIINIYSNKGNSTTTIYSDNINSGIIAAFNREGSLLYVNKQINIDKRLSCISSFNANPFKLSVQKRTPPNNNNIQFINSSGDASHLTIPDLIVITKYFDYAQIVTIKNNIPRFIEIRNYPGKFILFIFDTPVVDCQSSQFIYGAIVNGNTCFSLDDCEWNRLTINNNISCVKLIKK